MPSWVEVPDDQIDLDYHLRHSALPAPGSQRELGVLVSRLHSAKMDRRYPLWECHVIEGLEEDRWALYMKAHHSQVDGVGGIRLLRRMLSVDPEARDMLPPWAVGTHGPDQSGLPPRAAARPRRSRRPRPRRPGRRRRLPPRPAQRRRGGRLADPHLRRDAHRPRRRRPRGAVPRTQVDLQRPHPHPAPLRDPALLDRAAQARSPRPPTPASTTSSWPICGGALRRYLRELGQLPEESLTANVPVSVRAHEGARVGNAVTFLYAQLGTDVADPLERIEAHQGLHPARQGPAARRSAAARWTPTPPC